MNNNTLPILLLLLLSGCCDNNASAPCDNKSLLAMCLSLLLLFDTDCPGNTF